MGRRGQHLTATDVADAASKVYAMARRYSPPGGELAIDRILFGYLEGEWGFVHRQRLVVVDDRRMRLDFWRGTREPTAIELAVRPFGKGASTLLARANEPELRKLGRLPDSLVRTRVLLLMDFGAREIGVSSLRTSYGEASHHLGGRSASLVYVRRDKRPRIVPLPR